MKLQRTRPTALTGVRYPGAAALWALGVFSWSCGHTSSHERHELSRTSVVPTCEDAQECDGHVAAIGAEPNRFVALEAECRSKNAEACRFVGAVLLAGAGRKRDPALAEERLTAACELRDVIACEVLGVLYLEGEIGPRDPKRARGLFSSLCERGTVAGCSLEGVLDWNASNDVRERARVRRQWSAACNRGEPMGCMLVAQTSGVPWEGSGSDYTFFSSEEEKKASRLCALGSALACARLGSADLFGGGAPREPERGEAWLVRACHGNYAPACALVGTVLIQGDLLKKDVTRGVAFIDRACAMNFAEACSVLGLVYAKGDLGIQRDAIRGAATMKRACDLGSRTGCTAYATELYRGEGVGRNDREASRILKAQCDADFADACARLGALRAQEGDTASARPFFDKACRLNHALACAALKQLETP